MPWPHTPQERLRTDGPPAWQDAVRRAVEVAEHDADYTQRIEPWFAVDLLAIMIYCAGVPADEVDLRVLADRITAADQGPLRLPPSDAMAELRDESLREARNQLIDDLSSEQRTRLVRLRVELAEQLRAAGHDLSAPPDTDPVVGAWSMLDIVPTNNGPAVSEYSAWEMHPQGSTAMGRQLPTVERWLSLAVASERGLGR